MRERKREMGVKYFFLFSSSSSYLLHFPLVLFCTRWNVHLFLLFHSKKNKSLQTREWEGEKEREREQQQKSSPSCSNLEAGFQAARRTLLGMPITERHFVMNTHFLSCSCLPPPPSQLFLCLPSPPLPSHLPSSQFSRDQECCSDQSPQSKPHFAPKHDLTL